MLFSCRWSCWASPKYRKRGPDPSFSGELVAQRNYQQTNSSGRGGPTKSDFCTNECRVFQSKGAILLRQGSSSREKKTKSKRNPRGLGAAAGFWRLSLEQWNQLALGWDPKQRESNWSLRSELSESSPVNVMFSASPNPLNLQE